MNEKAVAIIALRGAGGVDRLLAAEVVTSGPMPGPSEGRVTQSG